MNNLIIKLLDSPEKDVFNHLTTFHKAITWNEIIEFFYNFLPHKEINNKYFWNKDLEKLEKFGFNPDFEDSNGNTLLFYLFSKHSTKDNTLSFDLKSLIKTTTKLYHINQYNENILFFMCKNLNQLDWETPDDFLNGQNLVDFIKKHPKFNIHQTNKLGRNLLFECLLNSVFPEKLVSFLIESNVDYTIKDKDGYNVLNLFSLMNFNQSSSKCFLKFTEKNDITNKNKFNDTCISNWLSFIKSDKHNQRNKTYYNWLNFTFENIQNEQISVNNKDYLINLLSEYTEIESPLLLSTIGFLKYKKLDEKLSSNTKKEKKIKL